MQFIYRQTIYYFTCYFIQIFVWPGWVVFLLWNCIVCFSFYSHVGVFIPASAMRWTGWRSVTSSYQRRYNIYYLLAAMQDLKPFSMNEWMNESQQQRVGVQILVMILVPFLQGTYTIIASYKFGKVVQSTSQAPSGWYPWLYPYRLWRGGSYPVSAPGEGGNAPRSVGCLGRQLILWLYKKKPWIGPL